MKNRSQKIQENKDQIGDKYLDFKYANSQRFKTCILFERKKFIFNYILKAI